jgi:hypothetical protein
VVLTWRKVSPSAWLMVDPRSGARAVIRDTPLGWGPLSLERTRCG